MKFTPEIKAAIDAKPYFERVRYAPPGDSWFLGETGEYWLSRMETLRAAPGGNEHHVACSKAIGWGPR